MKTVILSIHSGGNGKYRFYINSIDSRLIFKKRKQKVRIFIDNYEFETHTTCGPLDGNFDVKGKKGFDLYSLEISNWIIKKRHIRKLNGKCRIFNFIWTRKGDWIELRIVKS